MLHSKVNDDECSSPLCDGENLKFYFHMRGCAALCIACKRGRWRARKERKNIRRRRKACAGHAMMAKACGEYVRARGPDEFKFLVERTPQ